MHKKDADGRVARFRRSRSREYQRFTALLPAGQCHPTASAVVWPMEPDGDIPGFGDAEVELSNIMNCTDHYAQALALLKSEDVLKAAQDRRNRYQEALPNLLKSALLHEPLKAHLQQATALCKALYDQHENKLIPANTESSLARKWLLLFLDEAACTQADLADLANAYAQALIHEFQKTTITFRSVCPLCNFSSSQEFEGEGTIGKRPYKYRFQQKRLNEDPVFLGFNIFPAENDLTFSPIMQNWTEWVLILDVTHNRSADSYTLSASKEQDVLQSGFMTALRLFTAGAVDIPRAFLSTDSLYNAGGCGNTFSFDQIGKLGAYALQEEDIAAFQEFWRRFERLLPLSEHLPPRIQLAIEFFESSYYKRPFSKFLELCIAVEALFDINFEQTFRLPLRIAAFLAANRDPHDTHENVKEWWKQRNLIAHGDKKMRETEFRGKVRKYTPELCDLVRDVIKRHIDLWEQNRDEYEKTIKDFDKEFIISRLQAGNGSIDAEQAGQT